jgi:hypothetical protein
MSVPYKTMENNFRMIIIVKSWPMKFVVTCHLYVVDISLIGNK